MTKPNVDIGRVGIWYGGIHTIHTARIFTDGDAIHDRGRTLRSEAELGDHPVVVCVRRMDPDKRQRDLIAAVDLLRAEGTPARWCSSEADPSSTRRGASSGENDRPARCAHGPRGRR